MGTVDWARDWQINWKNEWQGEWEWDDKWAWEGDWRELTSWSGRELRRQLRTVPVSCPRECADGPLPAPVVRFITEVGAFLSLDQGVTAYITLGTDAIQRGAHEEAYELALKGLHAKAKHPDCLFILAAALYGYGAECGDEPDPVARHVATEHFEEAAATFQDAADSFLCKQKMKVGQSMENSLWAHAYTCRGAAQYRAGLVDDAVKTFRRVLREYPNHPQARALLTLILIHHGFVTQLGGQPPPRTKDTETPAGRSMLQWRIQHEEEVLERGPSRSVQEPMRCTTQPRKRRSRAHSVSATQEQARVLERGPAQSLDGYCDTLHKQNQPTTAKPAAKEPFSAAATSQIPSAGVPYSISQGLDQIGEANSDTSVQLRAELQSSGITEWQGATSNKRTQRTSRRKQSVINWDGLRKHHAQRGRDPDEDSGEVHGLDELDDWAGERSEEGRVMGLDELDAFAAIDLLNRSSVEGLEDDSSAHDSLGDSSIESSSMFGRPRGDSGCVPDIDFSTLQRRVTM